MITHFFKPFCLRKVFIHLEIDYVFQHLGNQRCQSTITLYVRFVCFAITLFLGHFFVEIKRLKNLIAILKTNTFSASSLVCRIKQEQDLRH